MDQFFSYAHQNIFSTVFNLNVLSNAIDAKAVNLTWISTERVRRLVEKLGTASSYFHLKMRGKVLFRLF